MLTGLGWLTRRQLGARRHSAQSWGYVESGRLDEVRVLGDHRTAGPGPHELICHPGEEQHARLRPRGRAGGADVGEGAPRARPARRLAVPLGGSVLSGAREPRTPPNDSAAAPEPYVPPQTERRRADRQGDRARHRVRRHLRRRHRLPGAQGGPDRVGVDPDRGAGDLACSRSSAASTILENNIVQTIGSAGESIAAGVVFTLPGFLFLGPRRRQRARRRRAVLLVLDDPDAGDGGRRAGRADDDPAAALADRQGARQPALPRGHRVRVGADRRREGRQAGAHRVPRAGRRVRLRASCRRSCTSSPRRRRSRSSQTNRYLPAAIVSGEITPEYLGVGYIIGPRIAGRAGRGRRARLAGADPAASPC